MLKTILLSLLVLFGLSVTLLAMANFWVIVAGRKGMFASLAEVPSADVAIVPGARVCNGRPVRQLRERLEAALLLYTQRKVTRILVSGNTGRPAGYDEVGVMAEWLSEHGVPEQNLLWDGMGFRTIDTMARAKDVFHIQNAIVCTQRYHLYRSVYLARSVGLRAVGLVADGTGRPYPLRNLFREVWGRGRAVVDIFLKNVRA